jgi:predicted phosphodiesterase
MIIFLSDIHSNLSALEAVIDDFENKYEYIDTVCVLGDTIGYGMRPNECLNAIKKLHRKYNGGSILGNHEYAIINDDYDDFKHARGIESIKATKKMLTPVNLNYIKELKPFSISSDKMFFVIHGSGENMYWEGIDNDADANDYSDYKYVFSGHTHIPHYFMKSFDCKDESVRNKNFVTFINPGSVGQPRNHNPNAQYVYFNPIENIIHFNSVKYDIDAEAKLYDGTMDEFYKIRLYKGI